MPRTDLAFATIAVALAACGKGKDKAEPAPAPAPAPAPTAPVTPSTPPAPPPDPFAMGSCEYTVDGGETHKGGGGISNVMSIHWMAADQKGRSIAVPLLINCGPTGKQLNISSDGDTAVVPMGPKKYPFGAGKAFTVMGRDFMNGDGSIDITAWDTTHVAGTFEISAKGKIYKGVFDIKCPQPGNGVCQ
jgi:hypothetical protein